MHDSYFVTVVILSRYTGTTNVDDEDDRRRGRDLTSVTRCKLSVM